MNTIKSETILVSVIIPNYCHSKYLDERIQSVLNQTYQNFEVIILDDCSPDNGASKAVIEKYRSNPHVSHIVYNETNSGSTFKQWNKGFELAAGELIWIAESDDFCDEDFLKTGVEQFSISKDVSVVFCSSQLVDERSYKIPPILKKSSRIITNKGTAFIKKRMLYTNAICNASSAVFSKKHVLSISKDYMNYVAVGDYLFWILLAETGNVVQIEDPKNKFRQHTNKVSHRKQRDGTGTREVYNVIQYLKSKGYVSAFQSLLISLIHTKETYELDFDSNELRNDLLLLWNYNGRITYRMSKILLKITYTLRLNRFI